VVIRFTTISLLALALTVFVAREAEAGHAPTSVGTLPWFFRWDHVLKDDTGAYGAVVSDTISSWNNQLSAAGSTRRVVAWAQHSFVDTWVVKSGYFEDSYLAQVHSIPSCHAFSSNPDSDAHTVRAFEQRFGDTWLGQYRYSRLCVNHDSWSEATKYFTQVLYPTQVNGMSHELGHSFALEHWTAVSVMHIVCVEVNQDDECVRWAASWAYSVQYTDALAVKEFYNNQ
jgi:hypothetical protein